MKKVFIILMLSISSANAGVYLSERLALSHVSNKAYQQTMDTVTRTTSIIVDRTLSDNLGALKSALGYQYGSFRSEVEYSFSNGFHTPGEWEFKGAMNFPATSDLKANFQTVFLNTYYDFQTGYRLKPYIGFGIGYVNIKETASIGIPALANLSPAFEKYRYMEFKDSQDNLGYNIGTGVSYTISRYTVELGYRYSYLGKVDNYIAYDSTSKRTYSMHEALLGIRVGF